MVAMRLLDYIGHGDAFVLRDPSGIRPAYYYQDDEVWWWPQNARHSDCFNVSKEHIKK